MSQMDGSANVNVNVGGVINDQFNRVLLWMLGSSVACFLLAMLPPYLFRSSPLSWETGRFAFRIFKTWSMVSTAFTSLLVVAYVVVAAVYNWRRQYKQTRKEQTRPRVTAHDWETLRRRPSPATWPKHGPLATPVEVHAFLSVLKVFHYAEEAVLEHIATRGRLQTLAAGESLALRQTDLAIVTDGRFRVAYAEAKGTLAATIGRGGTLTSYANVMRAFALHYNGTGGQSWAKTDCIRPVATETSQVLVIAEEAFRELARWSDLYVAHLTQVILTRFKRATLPLLLSYFQLLPMTASLLPYFVKRTGKKGSSEKEGCGSLKLSDLFVALQESKGTQQTDRLSRMVFLYLLTAFDLDHTKFGAMESSQSLLQAHIQLHSATRGETVQNEGGPCRGALLVLEGALRVAFSPTQTLDVSVGDIVGVLAALMGKCSAIAVTATGTATGAVTTYAVVSQHLLEMISERDPKLLFANIPDERTSSLAEFIDVCVDWQQRPCGVNVTDSDVPRVVKVLHGRVREVASDEGARVREYGIGSFIGEEDIFSRDADDSRVPHRASRHITERQSELAGASRHITVRQSELAGASRHITVRQSELAVLPVDLIEGLIGSNAQVAATLLPRLLDRQRGIVEELTAAKHRIDPIKTICLLPLGVDVGTVGVAGALVLNAQRNRQMRLVEAVAEELEAALTQHDTTWTSIDSGKAAELMGRQLFTTLGTLKMNEYLSAQEDVSRLLVYVADGVFSTWTRQCLSQADLVLLVADADEEVIAYGDLEQQMLHMNDLVNVELCLVSTAATGRVESRQWLRHRPWICAHHHLQLGLDCGEGEESTVAPDARGYGRNSASTTSLLSLVPYDLINSLLRKSRDLRQYLHQQQQEFLRRQLHRPLLLRMGGLHRHHLAGPQRRGDFGRLARRLLGRSLGLVLGGGGARGLGHIGVARALQEAGLEFDLIGGTSIGAFVGGLLARDQHAVRTIAPALAFSRMMASRWRQLLDLTYPATSWFTGHAFNRALWKFFATTGIEDLPVPFFAMTTDLTRSRLQVHRAGPAWQYIRASMSLSGFLPPVCDERDGTLLVDGGYLANVPIDLMLNGTMSELSELVIRSPNGRDEGKEESRAALAAAVVIAIDVGRASDRVPVYYGEALSGWTVLFRKLQRLLRRGAGTTVSVPLTLDEIQFRLAYASSAGLLSRTLRRSHAQLRDELAQSQHACVTSDPIATAWKKKEPLSTVLYVRPPAIQPFATMDFHQAGRIVTVGHDYGRVLVEAWREDGTLARLLEMQGKRPDGSVARMAPNATSGAAGGRECANCVFCRRRDEAVADLVVSKRRRRSSI